MIKQHDLYPIWEFYIDSKSISIGKKNLIKLSKSGFENFKNSFENNLQFADRIMELAKSEFRNSKIEDLFDDNSIR